MEELRKNIELLAKNLKASSSPIDPEELARIRRENETFSERMNAPRDIRWKILNRRFDM